MRQFTNQKKSLIDYVTLFFNKKIHGDFVFSLSRKSSHSTMGRFSTFIKYTESMIEY
ncbi:hypothetical protein LP2241_50363 [Pseudolactococcus piscium]|nr:hypothetical protein LP2241_50363 [Lactococcus piscium]